MDFVVVDVETANADLSSICQIGIASCYVTFLDKNTEHFFRSRMEMTKNGDAPAQ